MTLCFRKTEWRELDLRPDAIRLFGYISADAYDPSVRYVILFGSVARGEARLTSDVDIAVVSDESLANGVRWALDVGWPQECDYRLTFVRMEELTSDNPMHVGQSILRDGVILYERK